MAKKPTPAEKHDALYSHMPPDAQRDLNTIKSDLHRASREYTLDTHPEPVS